MCDPFNRTGANFVMVAFVLKTFVTRLLLLGHFQFCVLVCVCVLLFFLLFFFFFFFFFFCMLLLSLLIIHSIMTEAWSKRRVLTLVCVVKCF